MAIEVITRVIDDIDKVPVPDDEATLVTFAVNGKFYEMHLNVANNDKFVQQMEYYIEHAREVKPEKPKDKVVVPCPECSKDPGRRHRRYAPSQLARHRKHKHGVGGEPEPLPPQRNSKHAKRPGIVAWAREHGFGEIRGRASNEVTAAYDRGHGLVDDD